MISKHFIGLLFLIGLLSPSNAQIISRFTWDSNPVTTAIVGPNASSAGSTATSSPGGVAATNGLNPGAPTAADINLTIPNTGNVFDIPNIDISIDYRRNETTAQMLRRGTFTFNTGGTVANFRVTFRVNNGAGATTVSSTNVAIPSDNVYRNYRFTYDNCSGIGTMYVNNVVVWASPTPTVNQNLYWVSDGNIVIGQDMDGANNNVPNLDNFILQPYTCVSMLPIELLNFTGVNDGNRNFMKWTTATEKSNDFFTVERSIDGDNWRPISIVHGAGNSSSLKSYSAFDESPEKTINYYRLLQTDYDGTTKKFSVIFVDNSESARRVLKVTDLLGREVGLDFSGLRFIYYSDGTVIKRVQN